MRLIYVLFLVVSSDAILSSILDNIRDLGRGLRSDLSAVKQPLYHTVATVGSSQCDTVKSVLSLAYRPYDGSQEPNLDRLRLQFRTKSKITTLSMDETAAYLVKSSYDPDKSTVIFLHGYLSNPNSSRFQDLSGLLVDSGAYNVFALDSSDFTYTEYVLATSKSKFIGQKLGEVLADMFQAGILEPSGVHLIGHSLGAHVAGFAGRAFSRLTGYRLARISGLDPAGPCFTHVAPGARLNADDAGYVDVVHTNAGVYGLEEAIGDADYYVNGGSVQPNCLQNFCHHGRAWEYFAESAKRERQFPARSCQDWQTFTRNLCRSSETSYMGFRSRGHGVFYLRTREASPYGLGSEGLSYESGTILRQALRAGGSAVNKIFNFGRFTG